MKITLTSALGNIGKPLAQQLLHDGHEISIISHSPERATQIKAMGAVPYIGNLEDKDFLVSAFAKADALFLMNPSDYTLEDNREYYRKVSTVYAAALEETSIKRVVLLSSFGAHRTYGTGPILGSQLSEAIIKQVPYINLTILRPTYFYYNLLNNIDVIKNTGHIYANYGSSRFPMVAPRDIAAVTASELLKPQSALVRYIASSEHTGQEVATILGKAIGKPDLKWTLISDEAFKQGMLEAGIPAFNANLFTEMYASLESGALTEDYIHHKPTEMGATSLHLYAEEFATIYKN